MVGPLEVLEKFSVVVGGGLLDFKVYLSPLLGEGVRSRIERCSREGWREVPREVSREGEREESERGRGERRERRGERLRQLIPSPTGLQFPRQLSVSQI